jgi:hypothetical protein
MKNECIIDKNHSEAKRSEWFLQKDKLAFSLLIAPDNLISLNAIAFSTDIFQ